ncbi:DUF2510 domain-containing protein [Actinoplanes teichomyceticus]|uniref:DUF2510 domain-containing protein n=1 Tax=Actinoplanes teichomyceticus TaxID=1867 RepID=UPI001656868B|nr:DUF2510 domain-containing protein [Actinoplanes teichomyceticus]
MTSPAQPAGWYADPSGLPATRWWDGRQWTDHIQPGPAVLPPTAGLGGYYPTAAPSGPPVPGPHTVEPADPAAAEIFASRSSTAAGAAPAATQPGGALPAPAAEQIEYAMPPVDAATTSLPTGFGGASAALTAPPATDVSAAEALSAFGATPPPAAPPGTDRRPAAPPPATPAAR